MMIEDDRRRDGGDCAVEEQEETGTSGGSAVGDSISLSLRVLLVEGDDSTRHIISALLRTCRYHVAAVPDGLKAWEMLKESPRSVDVVLAEVDVPSISGISLLSLIMSHDACKHIPVIMMSPHDSINMVFNCMLKGAADFLVKPVRKNELRNLWQHVWRRRTSSDGHAGIKVHQDDVCEERFATTTQAAMNKVNEFSEKASDAESSCTRSEREADSAYNQNSLEPQQSCQGFFHIVDNVCAQGTIQPNMSLLDHERNDEGKSIMLGSECAPVNRTSISNEQSLEEEHSCARVETANESMKTTGSVCNESVTNDMEDQTYEEVTPPKRIVDFIGAIDNQRQYSYVIREDAAIDNDVHGAPKDFFHDGDLSSKLSSAPFLELSLRRCGHSIVDMEDKTECSTLNHSDSSAFSPYSRTAVSPMSRTVNFQAEGEGCYGPYTSQIPDKGLGNSSKVSKCNGTAQHVNAEKDESPSFGIFNQNGIAIKCSPIRVIPVHVPVGGMKFDRSTGYHTMTQPIFYPEPAGHFLWSSNRSSGQEAMCMSTSHQSETNDSSHQHPHDQRPENPILYLAELEHRKVNAETRDEPWHAATIAGDNASSRDDSSHINTNGHGRIFHEGDGNISTPNVSHVTPAFRSRADEKPADLYRISQREAALNKFRLKRKERCFEKKVRYQSRKRLAEQRPRVKGQFVRHTRPGAMDCQVEQAVG